MLTVTVEADATPPRVRIDTDATTITRTVDGATVIVRGPVTGGVIYDNEAPQGLPLSYSDGTDTAPLVELPDVGVWLVHLLKPHLSVRVTIGTDDPILWASTVRSLPLIGRAPHTVATGRATTSTGMSVAIDTREEESALRALLMDESVLWLSAHSHHGFGPWYVRALDVATERLIPYCEDPRRTVTLPLLVQDRPTASTADLLLWEQMPTAWPGMPLTWPGMPG